MSASRGGAQRILGPTVLHLTRHNPTGTCSRAHTPLERSCLEPTNRPPGRLLRRFCHIWGVAASALIWEADATGGLCLIPWRRVVVRK